VIQHVDGLVTSDCILLSCKTSFIQASNASQDRSLYSHTNCSDWPLNSKRSTTMAVIGCIAQLRKTRCTLEDEDLQSSPERKHKYTRKRFPDLFRHYIITVSPSWGFELCCSRRTGPDLTCVNLNWRDEGESERIDQFKDVGLRVPAVAPDAVAVSHRTPAGG